MNKKIKTILICLLSCLMLTCCFACNAKDDEPTVSSIAIATNPKTEYYIGDTLDITGATITVTYSDDTTKTVDVTIEMVTVPDLTTEGEKEVIITYSEKTVTYRITVSKTDETLLAEAKAAATGELDEAFALYDEADYLTEKWDILEKYYTDAKAAIESATSINAVTVAKTTALNAMAEVLNQEAQIANFNALVSGAVAKISSYDERSYLADDLETLKSKISAHTATLRAITFTGDDEADASAIQNALDAAIEDIATVKLTYRFIDVGSWTDSAGAALTEVTENLPDGISSAYVLNYNGSATSIVSIFSPVNGIDTTDLVENCGAGNKPTVVFTFWFYVEDASKLIGTNNSVTSGSYSSNGAGLNVYMGTQKTDSSVGRAFYLDGKWYKTSTVGALVSGWNKISLGTGTSDTTGAVAENIVFTLYQGADTDLNVKMMIADMRVEYLDAAQNGRAAVVDKIADITSISVKTVPSSVAVDIGATEYNPEGGVIAVNYSDGSTLDVDMTAAMITLPDTSSKGYRNATVSYTVRGITRTAEFEMAIGITLDDIKDEIIQELDEAYSSYTEGDYLAGTWAILTGYRDTAVSDINSAGDAIAAENIKDNAIEAMASLKKASEYTVMMESLKEAALSRLVLPAERNYTEANLATVNGILDTAIEDVNGYAATGDEATDTAAIETIVSNALTDISGIAYWLNVSEGTWSDSTGAALTEVTENLPDGISSAYALNYDGSASSIVTIFSPVNGIDTTDLVDNCGAGSKPTVVFTFWFYVEDASKLIGTNNSVTNGNYNANGAGLNVYMGSQKTDSSVGRAFYLDGKWFKKSTVGALVSGWNKISLGTGTSSTAAAVAENIVFSLYNGTDSDLNVKMMIADMRVEYLDTAQSARAAVVDKITDVSSVSVSTVPINTTLSVGATEYEPENGKITVTYSDGTTKILDLTADMCVLPDLSTEGTKQVTVSYTERGITVTATFDIVITG
ncbi:MAG: bacterial Ig-like domain-containing protein [Christensenellales bacterium]